jgi:hypothetical protein
MWTWIAGIALVAALLSGTLVFRGFVRRRHDYQEAMRLWQETAPERRRERFESLTGGTEMDAPAWYLLGCAYLQEGRPRLAARAFGVAHHADYMLETAALLTFACLKASEGPDSDIVEQMIRTWHEMRKPDLNRRREDQLIMDCLASTETTPPPLSPLGRLTWLTVPRQQQSRLAKMIANGDANAASLRPLA